MEDVICTRVLVASTKQTDLVSAWKVCARRLRSRYRATAHVVGVTALGYDNQLVEVEAIGAASG